MTIKMCRKTLYLLYKRHIRIKKITTDIEKLIENIQCNREQYNKLKNIIYKLKKKILEFEEILYKHIKEHNIQISLYGLYETNDIKTIFYIGQSCNIQRRIKEHKKTFGKFEYKIFKKIYITEIDYIEKLYISWFSLIYKLKNITFNIDKRVITDDDKTRLITSYYKNRRKYLEEYDNPVYFKYCLL
jgi:hypothetical protein